MCIALTPLDRTDRRKQDTCSRRRDHGLVADSDLHYCSVEYPNRVCVGCRARSRDARDLFFLLLSFGVIADRKSVTVLG
jgi:hypothetical protein